MSRPSSPCSPPPSFCCGVKLFCAVFTLLAVLPDFSLHFPCFSSRRWVIVSDAPPASPSLFHAGFLFTSCLESSSSLRLYRILLSFSFSRLWSISLPFPDALILLVLFSPPLSFSPPLLLFPPSPLPPPPFPHLLGFSLCSSFPYKTPAVFEK